MGEAERRPAKKSRADFPSKNKMTTKLKTTLYTLAALGLSFAVFLLVGFIVVSKQAARNMQQYSTISFDAGRVQEHVCTTKGYAYLWSKNGVLQTTTAAPVGVAYVRVPLCQ